MGKCKYDLAWRGPCNEPTIDGSDYCEEHSKEVCCSCGAQATHQCSETMGLVCGAPLCDNCVHTTCENGCNSGAPLPEGVKSHDTKANQVYKPWMMRKDEDDKTFSEDDRIALYPDLYPDLSPKEIKEALDRSLENCKQE